MFALKNLPYNSMNISNQKTSTKKLSKWASWSFGGKKVLTLKMPRKSASENVFCLCRLLNILANFSNLFLYTGKHMDSDQTASRGAVWSGSTLFAAMTFKITSRWQSRRQLLWLRKSIWSFGAVGKPKVGNNGKTLISVRVSVTFSHSTLQPLYNTVHYNMVLDITRFKDGSQKCIDNIEKWQ